MVGWNKDGSTVKALYIGEYPCTGIVKESRVKYGGSVGYWLDLVEPLFLPNGEKRVTVMVDETQVTHDFGVLE